jgi:hypothetical protein
MSDVIETWRITVASGFTSPRWVPMSELPPVGTNPPSKPSALTVAIDNDPEVVAAKKKLDAARDASMATAKDMSKSVDEIKRAIEVHKAAEVEYKATRKRVKERLKATMPAK